MSLAAEVPRTALLASRALPMAWKCSFEKPGGKVSALLVNSAICRALQAEYEWFLSLEMEVWKEEGKVC